jgi:hypothetical protein
MLGGNRPKAPAEFPEKTYREKLAQFTEVLRSHLRDTNLRTRWSEA